MTDRRVVGSGHNLDSTGQLSGLDDGGRGGLGSNRDIVGELLSGDERGHSSFAA